MARCSRGKLREVEARAARREIDDDAFANAGSRMIESRQAEVLQNAHQNGDPRDDDFRAARADADDLAAFFEAAQERSLYSLRNCATEARLRSASSRRVRGTWLMALTAAEALAEVAMTRSMGREPILRTAGAMRSSM